MNREKEMEKMADQLEQNFELIGSSAIEDKLQVDVGKTIHDLKRAGIQVWVLTGDKVETAINIGTSCRLLDSEMNMFILEQTKPKKVRTEIVNALAQQKITKLCGSASLRSLKKKELIMQSGSWTILSM